MANKKITDLPDIGTPDPLDVLEIVDVSTNTSKKVLFSELGGGGGATPTLQEVTDVGNETTNSIKVNGGISVGDITVDGIQSDIIPYVGFTVSDSENQSTLSQNVVQLINTTDITFSSLNSNGELLLKTATGIGLKTASLRASLLTASRNYELPNQSGTLALLSDIPTVSNATETVAGIAEIATTAEVTTGTDDTRIVTPLKLKAVTDLKANKTSFISLISSYSLTATTVLQKIFNTGSSGNGAFNTVANSLYDFRLEFDLTILATSSNFSFGFLGTAVITSVNAKSLAIKVTGTSPTASAIQSITSSSETPIVLANVGNTGRILIMGTIRTTTSGTLIPSIALGVSPVSASINEGAFFKISKIGTNTDISTSDFS